MTGANHSMTYVGLDVSLAETHVCVLREDGKAVFQGAIPSELASIVECLNQHAPNCQRVAVETGATTPWLWRELRHRDVPVICVDARHASQALSMRRNKTDRNDAEGLAELMRIGWYKEANVRTPEAQFIRSMLSARYQMRLSRRDLLNQMRGIVKTFGLITESTGTSRFPKMVADVIAEHPAVAPMLKPLLDAHDALSEQIRVYDDQLKDTAAKNEHALRIMTIPGVSYLVTLGFMSTIDDPKRFSSSAKVGPYLGLAPRTRQSGESSYSAGIGQTPSRMVRSYLYQAATVLLTRSAKWSRLKAWGLRIHKRAGFKRAAIAVARKLAIIMHSIWVDGTEFEYGIPKKTAA
ncbi:IS110 family transposase [Leisingera sp. NJS204]|uniref:IS110 family transposase n=1 Tax=Leisingera sp. NJS204 TaxID=2508307 RepID=UPI001981A519|nr:IS110 family transposase [Leisingera sp. NJS204]